MTITTLNQLMAANAGASRGITYHAGEGQSRRVTYGDLRERALILLHRLQAQGARPGDRLILLLLVVLAAVAVFYLSGMSGSEAAKDNAIADAAQDVGAAAGQVGDAAQDAADSVTN